uniref:Uncharacterized protein n=1 Tax=Poecilia reticulata TaxID=8081 RepID=A0A3P9PSU0_POERE
GWLAEELWINIYSVNLYCGLRGNRSDEQSSVVPPSLSGSGLIYHNINSHIAMLYPYIPFHLNLFPC